MRIKNPADAARIAYPFEGGDFIIECGEIKEVPEPLAKNLLDTYGFLEIAGESNTGDIDYKEKHKELFGKYASHFLGDEKLKEKVLKKMKDDGLEVPDDGVSKEQLRREEAMAINSQEHQTISDTVGGVVFKDGEPYLIIDDKYVPHDEGEIIIQQKVVDNEKAHLEYMKERLANRKKML